MKVSEFFVEAEGYYNLKYNAYQKKYITMCLKKVSEKQMSYVFAEVLKILPLSLRALPGVSVIDNALKVVKKERTSEIYKQAIPEYDLSTKANSDEVCELLDKLKEKIAK